MKKLAGGTLVAATLIGLGATAAHAAGAATVTYSGATCSGGRRSDLIVHVTNGSDAPITVNVAGFYLAYGSTINAGDGQSFDFPASYPLYEVTVTGGVSSHKSFTWPDCPVPTTTTVAAPVAAAPIPVAVTPAPAPATTVPPVTVPAPAPAKADPKPPAAAPPRKPAAATPVETTDAGTVAYQALVTLLRQWLASWHTT